MSDRRPDQTQTVQLKFGTGAIRKALPVKHVSAVSAAIHSATELPLVDREHYVILEEYARGGLGRILRARDRRTGRIVAIKEMLGEANAAALRFVREALVTANLQHPAIVPIYELGRWESGEPFYAMKLVAGRSLERVIKEATTLDARLERLPVVTAVAEALAYAHAQRVIHRDLKPANVLVGDYGETVVIDWGLAKVIGQEDVRVPGVGSAALEHTVDGAVLGTPHYMPPEQARGGSTDERADVYAIGAMLYHLITGDLPFADQHPANLGELTAIMTDGNPTPITTREPRAPVDLVTIVMKAMSPDPAQRYLNAGELADELRRFSTGKLVRAHRYDRWTLVRRWIRRHRAAVAVGLAMVIMLMIGGVVSVWRIIDERNAADFQRFAAEAARDESQRNMEAAREGLALALYQKGLAAETAQRWALATMYYAAARVEHETEDTRWAAGLAEARSIVPVIRYREHTGKIVSAAVSTDGAYVATVDDSGMVRVWSPRDGRTLASHTFADSPNAVAFSPTGRELAVAGGVGVHRVTTDLAPLADHPADGNYSLAYSPDGALLASGAVSGVVRVWRLTGPATPRSLRGHRETVISLAFSPDGKRLATGSDDRRLWIWDVATGVGQDRGGHIAGGITSVAFTRAGDRVLTVGFDYVISLWSNTGDPERWSDEHALLAAAITRDDTVIATSGDSGRIRFWETATHRLIATLDSPGRGRALVFSPDDRWMVSAGGSNVATVWNVEALPRLLAAGHRDRVTGVAFSADGARLISGSSDHTVRAWNVATGDETLRIPTPGVACEQPRAITGGIVAGCDDASFRRWDGSGHEMNRMETGRWLRVASISPDGKTCAAGHMRGEVDLIDLGAWKRKATRIAHTSQIYSVVFAATGVLATASIDNTVALWTPGLGLRGRFDGEQTGGIIAGAPSPDGSIVVAGTQNGTLLAWDTASKRLLTTAREHDGTIWELVFSPDGQRVYSASEDGRVQVWDVSTWRPVGVLDAEAGPVLSVAISPDGHTVATGHRSSALVVWDAATAKPRYRIGGQMRNHGSCENHTTTHWVSSEYRKIVEAVCTSDPARSLERFGKLSHQRMASKVDVVSTDP